MLYLWEYFLSLSMRRSWSGQALNPISNLEVLAWSQLRGISLTAFEVEVLESLENTFLSNYKPQPLKKKAP